MWFLMEVLWEAKTFILGAMYIKLTGLINSHFTTSSREKNIKHLFEDDEMVNSLSNQCLQSHHEKTVEYATVFENVRGRDMLFFTAVETSSLSYIWAKFLHSHDQKHSFSIL